MSLDKRLTQPVTQWEFTMGYIAVSHVVGQTMVKHDVLIHTKALLYLLYLSVPV